MTWSLGKTRAIQLRYEGSVIFQTPSFSIAGSVHSPHSFLSRTQ